MCCIIVKKKIPSENMPFFVSMFKQIQLWNFQNKKLIVCLLLSEMYINNTFLGGGFGMRDTCTPVADSCQCMAKPPQYYKVISLN